MKDISLMYLFDLALRRIWALILAAVVFGAAAFCYCKFLATPQYTATASVLVTNGGIMTKADTDGNETISTTDISASINLVDTVMDILETSEIYKKLSESIDGEYSYKRLKAGTTISSKADHSMFVDVSFRASSPQEATEIVNAFVQLTPEYIVEFVPYSNVAVAATADSAALVFPRTTTSIFISSIVGVVVAFAVALLIDSLDQAVLGEADFTMHYDIPLVGNIPDFESMGIVSSSNYYQKGVSNSGY